MDSWSFQLPTRDKNKLSERELDAGLNSLKLFKLDEASRHFEGKQRRCFIYLSISSSCFPSQLQHFFPRTHTSKLTTKTT